MLLLMGVPAGAHPRRSQHLSIEVEVRLLHARLRRVALALAVAEDRLAATLDGTSDLDDPRSAEVRLNAKRARAAAEECRALATRIVDLDRDLHSTTDTVPADDPAALLGGRYRLDEALAVGGMGEVWRAEDTVLARPVAVKMLRAKHAGDPELRARLRAEARSAALLTHPNVTQVFDFGGGDMFDPPYLVMEYVPAQPLSNLLAYEAPFSEELTWSVVAQTAAGLAAAHGAGVVHGDIKPGNLLLCPDGRVKITDFGVARVVGQSSGDGAPVLIGTAHYIAPERILGAPATPAGDLYALGVLAYACLTGRPPFVGRVDTVLTGHQLRRPRPLPTSVPPDLRHLVTALLAKKPAGRPRDAESVVAVALQHAPSRIFDHVQCDAPAVSTSERGARLRRRRDRLGR